MQNIQLPSFLAGNALTQKQTDPEIMNQPSAPAVARGTSVLGAALRADFEALQNDFEQANAMAVDLQGQLAGKTNEFAQLKHLFEKASYDLVHLQNGIAELREERHRLANEAMRATALEQILLATSAERDKLKSEIEILRTAWADANQRDLERNAEITNLTADLQKAKLSPRPSSIRGGHLPNPKMALIIQDLSESVNLLRELMEDRPQAKPSPDQDFIAISFTG